MSSNTSSNNIVGNPSQGLAKFYDIKPLPNFYYVDWWTPTLWVSGSLILLACAYFYIKSMRRKRELASVKTAYERALEELLALERSGLETHSAREFAGALSAILRAYLEAELSFSALESTQAEIARDFIPALNNSLPNIDKQKAEALDLELQKLLSKFSYLCFSSEASDTHLPYNHRELSLEVRRFVDGLNVLKKRQLEQNCSKKGSLLQVGQV